MVNGEGGERGGWPMGRVASGRVAKGGVANGRVATGRVAKVATPGQVITLNNDTTLQDVKYVKQET